MPIINPKSKSDRTQIRINIDTKVLENVRSYCDWAGINKIDEFLEQASQFVMKKDKEWKSLSKRELENTNE